MFGGHSFDMGEDWYKKQAQKKEDEQMSKFKDNLRSVGFQTNNEGKFYEPAGKSQNSPYQHLASEQNIEKDADGKPIRPRFDSLIDANTGLLQSPYQIDAGQDIVANKDAINKLRGIATQDRPSAWANAQNSKIDNAYSQQVDQLRAQTNASRAGANRNLAMRGGLSSGARERIASNTALAEMKGTQDLAAKRDSSKLDIAGQDYQNQVSLLSKMPALENQALSTDIQNRQANNQANQFNIQAALEEKNRKNQAEMNAYTEQIKAWAAIEEAKAI